MTIKKHIWTQNEIDALKQPRTLPTSFRRTLHVNSISGLDTNDGTELKPIRTIRRAGQLALPGDRVACFGTFEMDAFYHPNSGEQNALVYFVGIPSSGQRTKIVGGMDGGIVIFNDTHHVILDNFDISEAETLAVIYHSNDNLFKNIDFHDGGSVQIMHNSSRNRFECFQIWNIGQPADNNRDGIVLMNGANENQFVSGFIGDSGHAAFNSNLQNNETGLTRENDRNFLFDIVINNKWSGGLITSGQDRNLYAEQLSIYNSGKSHLAEGAGSRMGMTVSGKDGTFKNILIAHSHDHGITVQAYKFGGVAQEATGNRFYNVKAAKNGNAALQFGTRHGLQITDNVFEGCDFRGNFGFEFNGERYSIEVEQYHETDSQLLWTLDNVFGNKITDSQFDADKSVVHFTRSRLPLWTASNPNALPDWSGNVRSTVITPPPPPPPSPIELIQEESFSGDAGFTALLKKRQATGWKFIWRNTKKAWFEKV